MAENVACMTAHSTCRLPKLPSCG